MKITTLIFAVTLITGCGSSSDPVNPLAVVSDDEQTQAPVAPLQDTTSQPAPVTEQEQATAPVTPDQPTGTTTTEQVEPEPVSTPIAPTPPTPVEVEPQPEPVEPVVVEPIQEPEPTVVYATPDPFFGVPLICGRGPAPPGSPPTDFMRLTINEDGTFATTSIPNRIGVFIGAWSYAQGVIFDGTTEWTIVGETLRKDEAICVEEIIETVTETQTSVTLESLIGESLDCVIYGEQEGLVPHTLVFQEDGTLLRMYTNGNTQSFSWSEEGDALVTPLGSFSVVDDTLTTGSTNGWEYACTPRTA